MLPAEPSSSRESLNLEGPPYCLRLALDHRDQRTRGAGRPPRAQLPLAHAADASADQGGELSLCQPELVSRLACVGVARRHLCTIAPVFLPATKSRSSFRLARMSSASVGFRLFTFFAMAP